MSTAKVLPKSSSSNPKKRCTKRRWPVEEHNGSAARGREVPRRSRRGRSGRCAFPASLTLGQRERANIAQVALGRPYPKDRGRLNVTAVAQPPRPTSPQSLKPHADVVS